MSSIQSNINPYGIGPQQPISSSESQPDTQNLLDIFHAQQQHVRELTAKIESQQHTLSTSIASCSTASTPLPEPMLPFVRLRDEITTTSIEPDHVYQILCLNQNQEQTSPKCGFHVFFHALCALAIVNRSDIGPREYDQIFNDQSVYQYIEQLISEIRDDKTVADASEPQLRQCWNAIVKNEVNPFEGSLPSQWRKQDLTILNVGMDDFSGILKPTLVTSDMTSLESHANIKELLESKGPCHHVFLIGGEGHWITLIYEKDEKVTWYGLDSNNNNPYKFIEYISLVQDAIDNVDPRAYRDYATSIGDDLRVRCSLLKPDGTLYNIEDHNIFISDKDEPIYLPFIHTAVHFMLKMGWLDVHQHPAHEENIHYIKQILALYKITHSEDTRVQEIETLLSSKGIVLHTQENA